MCLIGGYNQQDLTVSSKAHAVQGLAIPQTMTAVPTRWKMAREAELIQEAHWASVALPPVSQWLAGVLLNNQQSETSKRGNIWTNEAASGSIL